MDPTFGRLGRTLLIFATIGVTFGCLLSWLLASPFLERWEKIGSVPEGTIELQIFRTGTVYAKTAVGKTYSLASKKDGDWVPDVIPSEGLTKPQPCDDLKVAFTFIARPPEGMIYCSKHEGTYAEMGWETLIALDSEGSLWEWAHGYGLYQFVFTPLLMVAGGVAGLLVGSLVWMVKGLISYRKTRRNPFSTGQMLALILLWGCLILVFGYLSLIR